MQAFEHVSSLLTKCRGWPSISHEHHSSAEDFQTHVTIIVLHERGRAAYRQWHCPCVNGETETSPATVVSTALSVSSTQMTAAASGDFPRSESWDPLDRPSVDWPGGLAASRTSPGSSRDFALSGLARCSGGGSTCIKGLVSVKRLNSRGFLPVALFLQLGLMRSASQTNVMDGRSFC